MSGQHFAEEEKALRLFVSELSTRDKIHGNRGRLGALAVEARLERSHPDTVIHVRARRAEGDVVYDDRFRVWERGDADMTWRISPDCLPGVLLTNIEEDTLTSALYAVHGFTDET